MKTVASLIRRIMVRARKGLKKGPTLKSVVGPSKRAYTAPKRSRG